ncbi:MAG: enoyl-CoA hydratase/isomerase family protein [Hyphomicrobiaceae bacterium]
MSTEPTAGADGETIIRVDGRAGRITLNRPQALNALTYTQIVAIRAALDAWRADDAVKLVILDATGGRALCAGGDVIAMYESRTDGGAFATRYWRDEYRLNAEIGGWPKPFVALMDGIVMGGGIGLSGHASHRIVTEASMLAMPETTIGLVPDVGGSWLLAQAPGRMGEYLGLIGERMGAADAIYAGFADTHVARASLDGLLARLVDPDGEPVGVTISRHASAPAAPTHAPRQADVDRMFAGDSVEAIAAALAASPLEWAGKAADALAKRSPLALKLTLAAIRRARGMRALEQALAMEFRLTTRLFRHGEFIEGVRALLVDKDKSPRWRPAALAGVDAAMISEFLSALPDGADRPFPEEDR